MSFSSFANEPQSPVTEQSTAQSQYDSLLAYYFAAARTDDTAVTQP